MQQIKHIRKGDYVMFYVKDDEKVIVLACGHNREFEEVEKNAAERYLEYLDDPTKALSENIMLA